MNNIDQELKEHNNFHQMNINKIKEIQESLNKIDLGNLSKYKGSKLEIKINDSWKIILT